MTNLFLAQKFIRIADYFGYYSKYVKDTLSETYFNAFDTPQPFQCYDDLLLSINNSVTSLTKHLYRDTDYQ